MLVDRCVGISRTTRVDFDGGIQLRQIFAVHDREHVQRCFPVMVHDVRQSLYWVLTWWNVRSTVHDIGPSGRIGRVPRHAAQGASTGRDVNDAWGCGFGEESCKGI